MIRRLAFLLLLCSPVMAEGPLFKHKDGNLDREFQNAYQDIRKILTGGVRISSVTIGTATIANMRGVTDGSNACTGCVGEYMSSAITTATNFPSTGNFGDLTSISLTAGDWDVSASIEANPGGATVSSFVIGISTTTGNSSEGLYEGDSRLDALGPTSTSNTSLTLANVRLSLSSSKTAYLKYMASFSVSTPQARGRISARRIR